MLEVSIQIYIMRCAFSFDLNHLIHNQQPLNCMRILFRHLN